MGRQFHLTQGSVESICAHRHAALGDGDPLAPPLCQSTTFARDRVGSEAEHQYSRVSNPTVAELEAKLGALESAPPAACFATGLAAETALFLATLRAGDHAVCAQGVYGGTTRLLRELLPDLGISVDFVDATDAEALEQAVRSNTRLVFVETPANPTLELTDIRRAAEIAHSVGALLAVDNTFLTAVLQRPLDLGADVSVYSTTKFVEGHSLALGGALVSRDEALLERIRFVRKCTGAIQSPFNAWLTLNGLKTLPLRIRRQSQTAATVARWLASQPGVERVRYPGLADDAELALAESQHDTDHGAVVTFEIAGGLEAGRAFAGAVSLCKLVEHVGSVETLLTHPASMTHADVPPDQRRAVGLSDGLLRLSVGVEPPAQIIEDLDHALDAARGIDFAQEEIRACHALA